MPPTIHSPVPVRLGIGLCAVFLLTGCEQQEQISTYTVPTHESLQTREFLKESAARKPKPARMLAAIAPQGPVLWFFKLQGPPDAVAEHEGEVRDFLTSLHFNAAGNPEWTLPKDWQVKGETPGGMRYQTLTMPGDLEMSVTKLPAGDDLEKAILDNINRWRNQLDLPFIEIEDLPTRTEKIKAGDIDITWLNITGKARPAAAMPGMPGGMPPMAQADGPARPAAARPAESSDIQFEKPAEWAEAPPKQFITAAFEVKDGSKQLSITVSRAGGSKVANINRWRGQLGVDPLPADEVAKAVQEFPVGKRKGELVEIKSETQTLIAVMIEDGERTVFVKLMGDSELAVRERKRFEDFVRSVKF